MTKNVMVMYLMSDQTLGNSMQVGLFQQNRSNKEYNVGRGSNKEEISTYTAGYIHMAKLEWCSKCHD